MPDVNDHRYKDTTTEFRMICKNM